MFALLRVNVCQCLLKDYSLVLWASRAEGLTRAKRSHLPSQDAVRCLV